MLPRKKKKEARARKEKKEITDELRILLDLVEKMHGNHARRILELIITSDEPVGEESVGKIIGIKANEARRIIQKMADEAIIQFRRIKRGDKGIHAWFINEDQIEGILLTRLKKTREKLAIRLKFLKEQTIFVCPRCGKRYTFDEAMDNDFRCRDDGALLEEYDPTAEIEFLEKKIKEIDEDLRRLGVI